MADFKKNGGKNKQFTKTENHITAKFLLWHHLSSQP
jgi:hypothetical protein